MWPGAKMQVWCSHVRTWVFSEANVLYWRKYLWHCWDFSVPPAVIRRPRAIALPLLPPLLRLWTEENYVKFGHVVRKHRLVNTVTASFNSIVGQRTKMSHRKRKRSDRVQSALVLHETNVSLSILCRHSFKIGGGSAKNGFICTWSDRRLRTSLWESHWSLTRWVTWSICVCAVCIKCLLQVVASSCATLVIWWKREFD